MRICAILAILLISVSNGLQCEHSHEFNNQVPELHNVFVIIGENTDLSELGSANASYIMGELRHTSAFLTNYFAVTHHSEANYIAMTSGQFTVCEQGDNPVQLCHQNVPNLFSQLHRARIPFQTWSESMPLPCYLVSTGLYAPKHNPQLFYDNVNGVTNSTTNQGSEFCQRTNLIASLPPTASNMDDFLYALEANAVADFNLIIPNLCDDGHNDCGQGTITQYDNFLRGIVPPIQDYIQEHGGVLFVTYDEGEGEAFDAVNGGNVAFIVWGPQVQPGMYERGPYNHYSFLRTLQDGFGLAEQGYLGAAKHAKPITEIWRCNH